MAKDENANVEVETEPAAPADQTGKLAFADDKGAGRSKWVAGLLALVLIGWMSSGYFLPSAPAETVEEATPIAPVTVAVIRSQAADVPLVLQAEGQSEPDRAAIIKAEAAGQVTAVTATRGDLVSAGQALGRINDETLTAQLRQAQTQLDQANRDLENAIALQSRGLATQDRVSQARAAQAAAEAALTAAADQRDKAVIRAPFAGRLNDLTVDVGEYVDGGDSVAEVLDNDPLTVVIQVPQQALARITRGQPAKVDFITGETRAGEVSFIGANADQQTRTFRVEISVPNPASALPAGLSARVALPTGQARGHFISPAILSLGTGGELGLKTVAEDNTVAFTEISIARAQTDGIWVTGLPEAVTIITVGQGFVQAGDLVTPVPADALATPEAG